MEINGEKFKVKEIFDNFLTVPDCWVKNPNKLGAGNGEAKLYISTKEVMRSFYGASGFRAKCFLLKSDLIDYMNAIKSEYFHPSFEYRASKNLPALWSERMDKIRMLDDVIMFDILDQDQIAGERGYVNSSDFGYQLIRELSLPLVSYISAMQLVDMSGSVLYYWKLFVDFDAIQDKQNALVFVYGKKHDEEVVQPQKETKKDKDLRSAREGQGKYRELLLEECPFCPITKINDERLLIASHIKPYAVSNDQEKLDPKNGFMLSPMYDKLFDRGFITFTDDKRMFVSDWISPKNQQRIGLINGDYIQALPLDDARKEYLKFHRSSVFHGLIEG